MEELQVGCPYCAELIVIEVEPFDRPMQYVEDCHVCCQPIVITATYSDSGSQVNAERENN